MLTKQTQIAQVFHALGDPTRRAIIEQIRERPKSASYLVKLLEISLPAVMKRLQLRELSGHIRTEKRETFVYWRGITAPMFARIACTFLVLSASALADASFDAALALQSAHRLPEARDAFAEVVKQQPRNAEAWHELGMLWRARGDNEAFAKAVECLEQATKLAPANEEFLADYGGTQLELASRTRSIFAVTEGRTALEKAVAMKPDDLDAREGLFEFFFRAPFFVGGSESKATEQLEEIRRRDPDRATALAAIMKTKAKEYAAAFALCDEVLARHPDNYEALYQYGRTADLSGQNLERALACLHHILAIDAPSPAAPQHTHVWYHIGSIQLQLGREAAAKESFATALKLDPGNVVAENALAKLK